MNLLHQIEGWSAAHNPKWLVFLRAALGLCLFVKGIAFLDNTLTLQQLIAHSRLNILQNSMWLVYGITWVHILGGFFIVIGLFTRAASLVQIPIILGAIVFINAKEGIFSPHSDFIFSVVLLTLLVIFAIEGGGSLSLDRHFQNERKRL